MADADARRAEPRNLVFVEVNAVRQPRPLRQPAGLFEQIDRALAKYFQTETLLVMRLAEMRVQLAIVALGELRGLDHQPLVD